MCGLYYYTYNEMAFMVTDMLDPTSQVRPRPRVFRRHVPAPLVRRIASADHPSMECAGVGDSDASYLLRRCYLLVGAGDALPCERGRCSVLDTGLEADRVALTRVALTVAPRGRQGSCGARCRELLGNDAARGDATHGDAGQGSDACNAVTAAVPAGCPATVCAASGCRTAARNL